MSVITHVIVWLCTEGVKARHMDGKVSLCADAAYSPSSILPKHLEDK